MDMSSEPDDGNTTPLAQAVDSAKTDNEENATTEVENGTPTVINPEDEQNLEAVPVALSSGHGEDEKANNMQDSGVACRSDKVDQDLQPASNLDSTQNFMRNNSKLTESLAPVIETAEAAAEVAGALLIEGDTQFTSSQVNNGDGQGPMDSEINPDGHGASNAVNDINMGHSEIHVADAGVNSNGFQDSGNDEQGGQVIQTFDGSVASADNQQVMDQATANSQILTQGDLSISVTPTGHVFQGDSAQSQETMQTADGTVDLQSAALAGQGFQQHPTYVLLQAPGDQDSGGQPQVFLAMQTGGITGQDPQQAYITLHPVSVEGQELSGTFSDGINLQQAIIGQVGVAGDVATMELGQQIAIGDLKGLQTVQGAEADGSQLLMSGGQVLAASGTDGSQQSVITYLPSLATVSGATGQIVIAAADGSVDVNQSGILAATSQTQAVLSTVASSAGSTGSSTAKAVSSSQPRRRLSNDPRTCNQCGRSFKYPSDLKKHLQIHTDIKKFHCEECNRSFRRLHQLNVHKRIHSGDKPYVCNRCGSKFRHDSTLTMHIRTRHDHLKPFACDGCGKKFGRMSHLRKHQRNVCGKGGQRGAIVACKYCDESFVKKMELKSHMITCEKRPEKPEKEIVTPTTFVCEHCGKEFARNYDFKRHGLCHTDEKPFQCAGCSKTFKERSSLNKHIKRMHVDAHDGIHSGDNSQDDVLESEAASNEISTIEDHEGGTITSDQAVSAADIIVSLAANMVATSEADGSSAAQALAQAGVIQGPDGQIIQTAGHTISAADILNFPEVAAALGFTTAPQDGSAQPTVITVSETVETDGVSAAMIEGVSQQIESAEVSIEAAEVSMDTDQTIGSVNVIVTKQVNGEGSYFSDHSQFEGNGQLIIDEESGITAHVSDTSRFQPDSLTNTDINNQGEVIEASHGSSGDLVGTDHSVDKESLLTVSNVDIEMNPETMKCENPSVKTTEVKEEIGDELVTSTEHYDVEHLKDTSDLDGTVPMDSDMEQGITT